MKKVAIVADLPVWEADAGQMKPTNTWHYCVWLSALRRLLEKRNDFDIHWIIPDKSIAVRRIIESGNQTFHLIPKARLTIGLYSGYLFDTYHILKEIRIIAPDLVHSWGTENSHSYAASFFRGKKLLSIQGILQACSQKARLARFERHQALYEPLTIRRFNHISTESPWAEEKVREISYTANFHHLEYAVEKRFFRANRALNETPACLYAGTYTPVKNVQTLIRAFSLPRLSHIELWLAGVRVEDIPNCPPNIHPLGPVNRETMVSLLSQAWCLVHPSLADTGPTIAKEARVMGLPVMLTSSCGSKQHIEHGKSGFIVEPDDITAMQDAVLHMTANKSTAIVMGQHGQDKCRKHLSGETMLSDLLNIYRQILN